MNQDILWTIAASVFGSFMASSGLWGFIALVYTKRKEKKEIEEKENSIERKAILGLLHDRLYYICSVYIANGEISTDEYDNLLYLYRPYIILGGNGTCERMMEEIKHLPISKKEREDSNVE